MDQSYRITVWTPDERFTYLVTCDTEQLNYLIQIWHRIRRCRIEIGPAD